MASIGWILAAFLGAPPVTPQTVSDVEVLYEKAVAAVQSDNAAGALRAFERVLEVVHEGHALHAVSVYGAGRASAMLSTGEAACKAVDYYSRYSSLAASDADKRHKVAKVLPGLADRCRAATAATAPATVPTPLSAAAPPAAGSTAHAAAPSAPAAVAVPPTDAPGTGVADAPPGTPPPAGSDASDAMSWRTPVGWGAVGLGVVGIGLSFILWNRAADARDAAAEVRFSRSLYESNVEAMEAERNGALGLTIGGALFSAGGAAILLWPSD